MRHTVVVQAYAEQPQNGGAYLRRLEIAVAAADVQQLRLWSAETILLIDRCQICKPTTAKIKIRNAIMSVVRRTIYML